MSTRLAIRGLGMVGGFGRGQDALLAALSSGEPPVQTVTVEAEGSSFELPAYVADLKPLAEYVQARQLRRTDRFSRLAMLAVYDAIADAEGLGMEVDRETIGLIAGTGYGALGTTFGFMDSVIDHGDVFASPTMFSNSVHSAAKSNASISAGIRGPGLTISQFEMSVHTALMTARLWLQEGRVDAVICGGTDEYFPFVGYCRERFFGDDNNGPIRPFDLEQQSAVVGEGAAFMILTREDESPTPYGYIEDIKVGSLQHQQAPWPENAICLAGADGHVDCGKQYISSIPDSVALASAAPAYGSFPSAVAMDMAVAAIACRRGALPLWKGAEAVRNVASDAGELALGDRPLTVYKTDRDAQFGLATFTRGDA